MTKWWATGSTWGTTPGHSLELAWGRTLIPEVTCILHFFQFHLSCIQKNEKTKKMKYAKKNKNIHFTPRMCCEYVLVHLCWNDK
jgi:hypothetical protein